MTNFKFQISKEWTRLLPIGLFFFLVAVSFFLFWQYMQAPNTLDDEVSDYAKAGEEVVRDLSSLAALPILEEEKEYVIADTVPNGIQIKYAGDAEPEAIDPAKAFQVRLPKNYRDEPMEVRIAEGKSIFVRDKRSHESEYTSSLLAKPDIENADPNATELQPWWKRVFGSGAGGEIEPTYLGYQEAGGRKSLYYSYAHDQASNEKTLKNWVLYAKSGGQEEKESYSFEHARLKKNEAGQIEVYYMDEKALESQKAATEVDPSLMARAQRTLEKELGQGMMDDPNARPDFVVPRPYYINARGEQKDLDWTVTGEGNEIALSFTPTVDEYPLALDPTLAFTAPGQSNTGATIDGESSSTIQSLSTGDLNADGKTDLVVGAYGYSTSTGRAYIFYNDGSLPTTAATADVIITGETTSNYFGYNLSTGDLNADGKTDLVVGAYGYSTSTGRAYIFYNGSIITENASGADVIITGETTSNNLGYNLSTGDLNADGKTDLVVGAYGYSTSTGRAYIFYNGSITTENASGADVIITGETTSNNLGDTLAIGDLNADGKVDLAVGAWGYSTNTGRAYIFYNGSITTENASGADVIITGGSTNLLFAQEVAVGDINTDSKTDLIVRSNPSVGTDTLRLFYNDGAYPTVDTSADVTITAESFSTLANVTVGDVNNDSKVDIVAADNSTVRIFYNDGSYPATAVNADIIITGQGGGFGNANLVIDFNLDGKNDIITTSPNYSPGGRVYIFYSQNGLLNTNQSIASPVFEDFGTSMTSADFNNDGRLDLAVGAPTTVTQSYTAGQSGNWTVPAGITAVTVEAYGAGGSGGGSNNASFNGGGGGGGEYRRQAAISVTPGGSIAYSVAPSVTGATGAGTAGAATTFNSTTVVANGGTEGTIAATGLGGAGGTGGTGSTANYDGGAGANGSGVNGGGGGEGASNIAAGDPAVGTIGGSAGIGGEGGAGGAGAGAQGGNAPAGIGGGGGGSGQRSGGNEVGGSSTGGQLNIHYGGNKVFVFYNDSASFVASTSSADLVIFGNLSTDLFGSSLSTGDFNADGKADLAVGASGVSNASGSSYIFYNDGSIPTTATTADVTISGQGGSFGAALASGDFNADGEVDLAVGASGYSTSAGRAYVFYNDGSYPSTAGTADAIITGEAASVFGYSLIAGDLNADSKVDLVVSGSSYSTQTGRAYIFYNGAITTEAATGADVIITGEATSDRFGLSTMSVGDFNADSKIDLAVGAPTYSSSTGRAYIFYNGSIITENASGADVIITGDTSSRFGEIMTAGDFNADGRMDFAVGAYQYSSSTGRAYIFYNDGSIPTTAATADVTITGNATSSAFARGAIIAADLNGDGRVNLLIAQLPGSGGATVYIYESRDGYAWRTQDLSPATGQRVSPNIFGQEIRTSGETDSDQFGYAMATGDLNADGKTDLAVGANGYSSSTGRAYIFYNDGSQTGEASSADLIITGEAGSKFGSSLVVGDFNADSKIDLAVGAIWKSSFDGGAYIFYNDGSIPTTAATADVTITGETLASFGYSLISGDLNADGKVDLAVGGYSYSSAIGRAYIFYNDGSIPTTAATADVIITGEAASNNFGISLATGDLNADGKTDLAVGAEGYSSSTGRAYIFYNGSIITENASGADIFITGGATTFFGRAITTGDFNADSKTDLVISTNSAAYIFYNDGSIPTTAATADVTITGGSSIRTLIRGDINADGKVDLVIGDSNSLGSAYILYNDGSYPNLSSADITISGEAVSSFGFSLAAGDMNFDGKTDLIVGAYENSTSKGRVYIYTSNDGLITGGATSNYFGYALTTGDLNADGRTDLAVGAYGYSTNTGRVYVFYGDTSIDVSTSTADVTITGEASSDFGFSLATGDLNADGETDLVAGGRNYASGTGRVYIFYNDGSIPTTAATADVFITGESGNGYLGTELAVGDLNADGEVDLITSAEGYAGGAYSGRVYVFYADGTNNFGTATCSGTPAACAGANADAIITGSTGDAVGGSIATGDLNSDGKVDLVVGAYGYSNLAYDGRAYIFYNGSITTEAASGADVTISANATGDLFGGSLVTGDFNADSRTDLAVSSVWYGASNQGAIYIFYNDGSMPTTVASADVSILASGTSGFGDALATGDFNADGRIDLAIGSAGDTATLTNHVYIFYNDGTWPVTPATADLDINQGSITGRPTLTTGDMNFDGVTDLIASDYQYTTNTGRVYVTISETFSEPPVIITPQTTVNMQGVGTMQGSFQFR